MEKHPYMREHFPDLYARMKETASARWEPRDAIWVKADANLISGESLIRQILYGARFFRGESGRESDVLRLPELFSYSGALPQVLRGCGIRYLLSQKNRLDKFPQRTFWWEGIDGSRVLTHLLSDDTCLPEQRDHGEQGSAGEWFQRMEADVRDLPSWTGELFFECPRGAYTLWERNEWENRQDEFLLRDAEFLAAIRPGGEYPRAELEEAWKLLLQSQFHDDAGPVREELYERCSRVREIGEGAVEKSLDAFDALLDTGDLSHPIVVWNTLSFARSGVVSVPWKGKSDVNAFAPRGQASRTQLTEENGERRLLVEVVDAPPMGYIVYELRERTRVKESALAITGVARAGERALENELVRVELNERGEIVSYFDKGQERQIIAPGNAGNRFQLYDGRHNNYNAWDQDPFYDEVYENLTAPAVIEPVENGPLRASLRIERQLTPRARLLQFIRLEANSRRLDFETYLDWQESRALLKVAFPVTIHSPRATCDIQFGHLDRPTHRNTSWDFVRFEINAHKWVDLSESDYGVALLNDGKYGYDVRRNVLRLSLPPAPDNPDGTVRRFTCSLLPHRGAVTSSGVPLAGYDLNVPFRARLLPVQHGMLARAHSYFRVDKPNLVIEAVKRAEDGDGIIVRLFEAYRRRGTARLLVNGLCSRATRTDLLERNLADLPVQGGAVAFEYKPFEIITLRLR